MIEVAFSPGGWIDLSMLGFDDRLDVIHKLGLIEKVGLAGELKIGEIAPDMPIYLLYSGHHHIALAHNDLSVPLACHVVAVRPHGLIDRARRAALVNAAAREMGMGSGVVVY